MRSFAAALLLATSGSVATAYKPHGRLSHQDWQSIWHLPGKDWQHVPTMGNATFKQLIDHNNPSLGTFEQFYFYDTTHWKGPGE
jgi:hypothetical protein